jgi:hypothetical protein
MDVKDRILAFSNLGKVLERFLKDESSSPHLKRALIDASHLNPWFVKEFELQAIRNIIPWLDEDTIKEWISKYCCKTTEVNVGIIMAGNIPLVGFHDFLSTVICGHNTFIKLSGKDKVLLPAIIDILKQIEPGITKKITVAGELPERIDALIATGSDNTARYFQYYYKNIPKIIRKNRSSVAILTGKETAYDYELLAKDICTYFGLGCRNVSKIFIPNQQSLLKISDALKHYDWLMQNSFYSSNLKFQRARLRTIEKQYIDAGNVLFVEGGELHSPVGIVNYELYKNMNEVENKLQFINENLQCTVGKNLKKAVPLGSTQQPQLCDYADDIDTMEFLTKLPAEV